MGFMTLENFRTDLQSALGDRGIDNTRLDRWVNFGYVDLSGAISFEMLEVTATQATTAADPTLDVPADIMIVKILRDDTNDRLLGWLPKNEYFRRSSAATGPPTHWSRHGDDIVLHPVPDDAYDIEIMYQTFPELLAAASDTTVLPNTWDVAVLQLSVYHGLQALGEEQRASLWYNRAVNYIQTRMTEDLHQATASGIGLSIPPIRQLDIRPFIGQGTVPQQGQGQG